ncbi:MAG: DUF5777 family beta-barrel protein [Bacteroidota bacterium]
MNRLLTIALITFLSQTLLPAQTRVYQTFKDTRVINTHSVETTPKRKLDVRIGHRFGDFAGDNGGWPTFYGLENATDVMIGAEYGATDRLTVGLHRTKGAAQLRQLLHSFLKYRLLSQKKGSGSPITLTLLGMTTLSTMEDSNNPELLSDFQQFSHRMSYHIQVLMAHQFSERFSLQFGGGYTHRNLVMNDDTNGIPSLSIATRIQLTKIFGLIADFTLPFSDLRSSENGYYPPLGIGLEIETGGHVFQVNLTNATAIMETDYIPNTRSNWGDGQYRIGFTISRLFNL